MNGNRHLDNAMSYPRYQVVGHHPSLELQIDDPPFHRRRRARRPINDPMEVTPEVSPISIPLAVLPPAFITPTQVPLHIPVSTPMVVPGAAPAALGTGGTSAPAVIHSQIDHTTPEVPRRRRRSDRFRHRAAPAVMDTGPWYSTPRLVRSSCWLVYPWLTTSQPPGQFTTGPVLPFPQPGTVPPMLLPSTQPGAVPPTLPPFTQVRTSGYRNERH